MAAGADFRSRITVDATQATASLKELGTTGEQAFKQVDAGTKTATQSLRSFTKETTGMRRATGQLFKNFNDMGRSLESVGGLIGSVLGGVAGGVIGVGLAKAIGNIVGSLDTLSERLSKLQEQARASGAPALGIQAAGRQALQAGQDAAVGEKAFTSFAEAVEKAKAAKPQEDTGGVKVLRGGVPVMLDFSNGLETLSVNLSKIKTPEDMAPAFEKAAKRAVELGKIFPQQMNRLSQDLFGVPLETLKEITQNGEKLTALIEKLKQSAAGATQPLLDQNKQLKAAQGELSIAFEEMFAGYNRGLLDVQIATNKWLAGFVRTTLPGWGTSVSQFFANFLPNLATEWDSFWKTRGENFTNNTNAMLEQYKWATGETLDQTLERWRGYFSSLVDMAVNAAGKIADAVKGVQDLATKSPGAQAGVTPVMPMATGGPVPGTGTGDSVRALLTPGEFVMRRSVVDAFGAPFFAALNGSMGSFLPRTRFATGGLVADTAGGGTPVHLHLGGQSFALSGTQNVVSALVVEAHRQQIRSAGVKPSWYGGR
jgi:hypothetical protein